MFVFTVWKKTEMTVAGTTQMRNPSARKPSLSLIRPKSRELYTKKEKKENEKGTSRIGEEDGRRERKGRTREEGEDGERKWRTGEEEG